MPVITDLGSLIERVVEEDTRKYDFLADTRRMSMSFDYNERGERLADVLLNVDTADSTETLKLSDHALGQMATDLGIPKRYFDRMKVEAPSLFTSNVHHWLYEDPNRRMIRARRNGDVPVARAWLSDRYRRLDNIEIARRLLPEFERLSTDVQFHNASISDERFYLRAVFPQMQAEVKLGDAVQWGVQIRNSEVGAGTFAIESFVLRLVCINGMVVAKVLNARHIGKRLDESLSDEAIRADDKAFWLAARDVLRASISEAQFETVVATLRETTDGTAITAPIAATERLAKTYSLTDEERDSVLMNLATGGDMSRWGALNAITQAAQGSESFDRRVELEGIGWELASAPAREWERIAVAA